ncbi:prephenate dehydratase [Geothrix sp. PMB-07]|uniref:prephenate dehydratase n=1 Tax=Geothrix sp. PMB-07 TaxID=3068640 RepID=UPI0027407B82|nr:prephenate dehydratase [Geothrix sp. PMB-07]WLT32079.1 prephenate dehydratase [Geothrix sp. PMB-07]
MTQTDPTPLAQLRQGIDAVDDQVLALLNRRAALAAEVGRLKAEVAPSALFHVPKREREILARLEAANAGPFPDAAVRTIFQEIMSACLSLEKPLRVAFLGPEGTFTHLAARQQFGGSSQALPQGTIQAVFQAVERARADYGVVPVENATEGAVDSTLDAFLDSPLRICAEILLPVDQALLLRPELDLGGVRRVYSHPQALGQCRKWLEVHLPGADRIEAPSTSEAARLAREDAEGAAIASELAAELFGLRVAEARIQDLAANATRFVVLGPKAAEPTGRDRTTLVAMAQDGPGALLRLLEPLARRGLNLSRIQSRPTRRKLWEYAFFLDVEGHAEDPAMAEALVELQSACASLKVLGSYPQASMEGAR